MPRTENQLRNKQISYHEGEVECPVCGTLLNPHMSEEDMEDHDRSCEDPFDTGECIDCGSTDIVGSTCVRCYERDRR